MINLIVIGKTMFTMCTTRVKLIIVTTLMMILLGCVIAIDVDKDAGVDGDYRANHTDESHACKLERNIKIFF